MGKLVGVLIALSALVGCYNPRHPSETPGAEAVPHETGNSQETSVRQNRRDSAAGSGSSLTSD